MQTNAVSERTVIDHIELSNGNPADGCTQLHNAHVSYLKSLFSRDSKGTGTPFQSGSMDGTIDHVQKSVTTPQPDCLDQPVSREETLAAITALQCYKLVETDGIQV